MKKTTKQLLFERMHSIGQMPLKESAPDNIVRVVNTDKEELTYRNTKQTNEHFKPIGLWYSINDSWVDWCKWEMPEWIKKNNIIIDVDTSNILILKTPSEVEEFVHRFGSNNVYGREVDWEKVARKYKGIEIHMENIWRLRSKYMFISTWDVSSGCIWDMSCVKGQATKSCDAHDPDLNDNYGETN